ncbi:TPA: hypothetical protein HA361_02065 [Candidatus Woesearchaeota archaeon]|nr:hypothetical protein [Candidatus Woesearchaeota archaeon]HII68887.1 hypothetical protein [Candidatus Woesearchaeota archaeon]
MSQFKHTLLAYAIAAITAFASTAKAEESGLPAISLYSKTTQQETDQHLTRIDIGASRGGSGITARFAQRGGNAETDTGGMLTIDSFSLFGVVSVAGDAWKAGFSSTNGDTYAGLVGGNNDGNSFIHTYLQQQMGTDLWLAGAVTSNGDGVCDGKAYAVIDIDLLMLSAGYLGNDTLFEGFRFKGVNTPGATAFFTQNVETGAHSGLLVAGTHAKMGKAGYVNPVLLQFTNLDGRYDGIPTGNDFFIDSLFELWEHASSGEQGMWGAATALRYNVGPTDRFAYDTEVNVAHDFTENVTGWVGIGYGSTSSHEQARVQAGLSARLGGSLINVNVVASDQDIKGTVELQLKF